MSDTPLSEFLGSEEQPEIVEQQPEEQSEGRARDEHGRFVAKTGEEPEAVAEAAPEASAPPAQQEAAQVPVAALQDERQKRQQAEDRLRQYDEYFARLQAQSQQQPAPDMFEDPDGFKARLAADLRAELMQELGPVVQQHGTLTRAEVSEMLARQKHEDYDDKIEVFKEAMQANPFLIEQLKQAPDPATFAYNAANKYLEAKQYGGVSPSREQIEAELREKIMAEVGLSRPQAPSTFAGDRSVGSRSGPAWAGPTPLGEMLK